LGKIKKDTVIATLARKSEKNLWCTFKMVELWAKKISRFFCCQIWLSPWI